ncbi:MAG TPA: methyltransferase domain-containing protein [Gaiellaceae bacterium]|nr:methyltransferase domain-containing protein [Gaiellaceae bacterium]
MRREIVDEPGDLRAAWEQNAPEVIAWFRTPDHDSYWLYHREQFFDLMPPPGRLTLDIGCGEGRLSRDLKAHGHAVVALDGSPTMVAAAKEADPEIEVVLGDAADLPFPDGYADLAIAFMSLQDVEDAAGAIGEAARVLESGGRLCFAIVHPFGSAGQFEGDEADSPFVVRGSYLDRFRWRDELDRDGLQVTFESAHRPIGWYFAALESAGFLVERLRETDIPDEALKLPRSSRWQRMPLFLHVRAVKP